MEKIHILLADDHKILREGIHSLLERQTEFKVVAEADNDHQAVEFVCQFNTDVGLMDISIQLLNGIHATEQIHQSKENY